MISSLSTTGVHMRKTKGFTLIELLIVLAIFGIIGLTVWSHLPRGWF